MLTNRYVLQMTKAPKIIPQIKRALRGEALAFFKGSNIENC